MNVLLGVPALNGQLSHLCVEGMMQSSAQFTSMFIHPGRACMTLVRDEIVDAFLNNDVFDVLLWLDADIGFGERQVAQLLSAVQQFHFVAALQPFRDGSGKPAISRRGQTDDVFPRVHWTAFGMAAIHRKVFEAIPAHAYITGTGRAIQCFHPAGIHEGHYESEVMSFCRRATEVGFSPHVDTRCVVSHVGPYVYTLTSK